MSANSSNVITATPNNIINNNNNAVNSSLSNQHTLPTSLSLLSSASSTSGYKSCSAMSTTIGTSTGSSSSSSSSVTSSNNMDKQQYNSSISPPSSSASTPSVANAAENGPLTSSNPNLLSSKLAMCREEKNVLPQQLVGKQESRSNSITKPSVSVKMATATASSSTNEEYLNKKIAFIQNHINNLLIEITNLPEPWTYAVTEDGRVFFINEDEQKSTWLHPKTGQPVSVMIIPPLEDLPTGWQKDYLLGLPYLIDHNTKQNYLTSVLTSDFDEARKSRSQESKEPQESNLASRSFSTPSNSILKTTDNSARMRSPSKNNLAGQNGGNDYVPSGVELPIKMTTATNGGSLGSNGSAGLVDNDDSLENNDSALRKYGWLYKLSQNGLKLWKKRYFVLTDYILDYYSDSTMNKHCGTIFLNDTHSRPTVKKDGSSAFNKKNSFKVELIPPSISNNDNNYNGKSSNSLAATTSSNDMFIYLAAESSQSMNEWINKFNFVSKLKNCNYPSRNLNDKRSSVSNRNSLVNLNSSTISNQQHNSSFVIKHDNKNSNSSSNRSTKSNSAPSSPNLNNSVNCKNKIRSSMSSSANMSQLQANGGKKLIKKKLAFSDDEQLSNEKTNGSGKSALKNNNSNQMSDNETDYDYTERFNASYHQSQGSMAAPVEENGHVKHKRSSSLTKEAQLKHQQKQKPFNFTTHSTVAGRASRQNNGNYDFRSIYEAFEKPIHEMAKMTDHLASSTNNINHVNGSGNHQTMTNGNNNQSGNRLSAAMTSSNNPQLQQMKLIENSNGHQVGMNGTIGRNYKVLNNYEPSSDLLNSQQNGSRNYDNYIDKQKLAAATAAASAAAAAIEKEKEREKESLKASKSCSNGSSNFLQNRAINNFYNITKCQIENIPKNELQMLLKQLRRNFVLLNHSQQRFSLLHKLYEPYELIYQHRQSQPHLSNGKMDESFSMTELTMYLHDSYQTMKDRIKKVELKMDSVENSLKTAQQVEAGGGCDENNFNEPSRLSMCAGQDGKVSNYIKLYEYQIVEMQHEYELLLEDKIIVDKLLDNQMRIFSKYKNLSNEKTLIQQFNALNQEMELLQIQLSKINQLLNDTIAEKCKQELIIQKEMASSQQNLSGKSAESSSIFRASLVPVGISSSTGNANQIGGSTTSMANEIKSSSSIWKLNGSPMMSHKQPSQVHFSSIDNLLASNDSANYSSMKQQNGYQGSNGNYNNFTIISHHKSVPQSNYQNINHSNGNYYMNGGNKLDNPMSKSTDSIYTSTSHMNGGSNGGLGGLSNGGSAFNPTKKTALLDLNDDYKDYKDYKDMPMTFQPINNKQRPPQQMQQQQQQQQQQIQQKMVNTNFKRDVVAERKRASIGKYPNPSNYAPARNDYFQPIPVQQQPSMSQPQNGSMRQASQTYPTARERLFGSVNQQHQLNAAIAAAAAAAAEAEQMNSRKIAFVKPELRGSTENELINRFNQQNQMEYFDSNYSEEITKNIQKPDVFSIPKSHYDVEPDVELTEEERRAKEKKMQEIRKMVAIQSFQQMSIDDSSSQNNHSNHGSHNYSQEMDFEKEKKAREHLLDLRHELAEQIKERTRQAAMAANGHGDSPSNHSREDPDFPSAYNPSEILFSSPKSANNNYSFEKATSMSMSYNGGQQRPVKQVYFSNIQNSISSSPRTFNSIYSAN